MRGTDRDAAAIEKARANARRAGVAGITRFDRQELAQVQPVGTRPGLLCANPPYGVRLGDADEARAVHRELGVALRERFAGWQAAIITGDPQLGLELGLRAARTHRLWNGGIESRLLRLAGDAPTVPVPGERRGGVSIADPATAQSGGARMFANRLRKNLERLGKRARRDAVTCYRLYDADMPEYALAIDLYTGAGDDDGRRWLFVQEYAAPAEIDATDVKRRREEALSVLPEVTGIQLDDIHLRTRRRQRGTRQYQKLDRSEERHTVAEGERLFLVSFTDYLDTGLFLDHRRTRARLAALAQSTPRCRFLNLFAYTASASVHAIAGGARLSRSIDMSATYLQWARRNYTLNGISGDAHELLQADCIRWLAEEAANPRPQRYDLIFMDPPTFSNSARMEGVLDTQRDHVSMIEQCMSLLDPGGTLLFSTNAQRFKLEAALATRYAVQDTSAATLPFDFERNPRIHRSFEIRHAR